MIIFIFIFCSVAVILTGIYLTWHFDDYYDSFFHVSGVIFIIIGVVMTIGAAPISFQYIAAGKKAAILNAEYGTSYTREDIFFASDIIDTVQQIKRNRYEINGDLMDPKK